ncbi:MAG: hypothetical protein R2731_05485 [Nocardioides sp.]
MESSPLEPDARAAAGPASDWPRAREPSGDRPRPLLALGSAVAGLLAYAFFALVTRSWGQAATPVSVLQTFWGFTAAALTFRSSTGSPAPVAASGEEGGQVQAALPRSQVRSSPPPHLGPWRCWAGTRSSIAPT